MNTKNQKIASTKGLEMINPDIAGIDIGSKVHYVCVPEDRDSIRIKSFGSFTEDINMMAIWLKNAVLNL